MNAASSNLFIPKASGKGFLKMLCEEERDHSAIPE
jgi:hypothetical protein